MEKHYREEDILLNVTFELFLGTVCNQGLLGEWREWYFSV